jgi:hypothetical protein
VKHRQPETEVVKIFKNLNGKSREITLVELIFWRVFAVWNHCALDLLPLKPGKIFGH